MGGGSAGEDWGGGNRSQLSRHTHSWANLTTEDGEADEGGTAGEERWARHRPGCGVGGWTAPPTVWCEMLLPKSGHYFPPQ